MVCSTMVGIMSAGHMLLLQHDYPAREDISKDQLREEIRRAERHVQQWEHQLEMGIVPIRAPYQAMFMMSFDVYDV